MEECEIIFQLFFSENEISNQFMFWIGCVATHPFSMYTIVYSIVEKGVKGGQNLRYPEFLGKKGNIGFVAPSLGCTTEPYRTAFDKALDKFRQDGYNTIIGPNCYEAKGMGISNTPELCGQELNEMYCDSQADVIISCGGGELMCEVVPYIDFDRISTSRPKWYMGYSDNTNFTFLSNILSDTAAIYGPCAGTFSMEPMHESVQDAYDLLKGEKQSISGYEMWERDSLKDEDHPTVPLNLTEKTLIRRFPDKDTVIEGRLLGGCLDCLANLVGTEYDKVGEFADRYREDGIIWFLEACELNVMTIRRTLWNLKNAGWFKHVKGFLIGRPLCFGEECFGVDQYSAVTGVLGDYNVPIIMDMDIGHFSPMMPIVSGATAKVIVEGNNIKIDYTWQ